jgi:hypothetical protein
MPTGESSRSPADPAPSKPGARGGRRDAMPGARLAAVLAIVALTLGACAANGPASPSLGSAQAPTPGPSGTASETSAPSESPSERPSDSPTESASPAGTGLRTVPTACISIGADDCRRVVAEIGEQLPSGTAAVYVQVGPFFCEDPAGCAPSLADRAEGDVTIEAGAGALSWHVKADPGGGPLTFARQDAMGVRVGTESLPPVTAGVRPFTLGHCGLWSGIDVGGSWWDPVGPVDGDHSDSVNEVEGTLAILDPDHATFTSKNGFTVQLVRREGEKFLPYCM